MRTTVREDLDMSRWKAIEQGIIHNQLHGMVNYLFLSQKRSRYGGQANRVRNAVDNWVRTPYFAVKWRSYEM